MMEERAKRKLSAILSADVVGYSRLMGEDELATVRTLEAYREIIAEVIRNYSGRVVDSPGDNLLAEFSSVVDAVESAVEIQMELKNKNEELPEDRRMEFRIGINLGDVIEEGERIYGDGVNVAARIEGLAEGGGICISGTAFDHVEGKLGLEFEYLGEQSVKNIKKAVRVYRIEIEGGVSDVEKRQELSLPDKPSIAVLPFVNISDDPEQEYFSDGITEDIITDLSKISGLFVIARNSSFSYKGKPVKVQEVAKDLGVRYVLEGSVRRAAEKLRINAQLIDAATGHHLWAERYDRELKDIFSVQDEITQKVVSELAATLKASEGERLMRKSTENFEAYDMSLRALREFYGLKRENLLKAQELSQEVIELDPNFAAGYTLLSLSLTSGIRFGFSTSPREDVEKAFELAKKAVSVDDTFALGYLALASAYLMKRRHDEALAAITAAVRIRPGASVVYLWLGFYLHWMGRGEEAVQAVKKAQQLDPKYLYSRHPAYLDFMGYALFTASLYEESIAAWKEAIDHFGPMVIRQAFLAASYSELGREEEARATAQQLLEANPKFLLSSWELARTYKNRKDTERLLNALRKAELK
jgi:adenylate cyclase